MNINHHSLRAFIWVVQPLCFTWQFRIWKSNSRTTIVQCTQGSTALLTFIVRFSVFDSLPWPEIYTENWSSLRMSMNVIHFSSGLGTGFSSDYSKVMCHVVVDKIRRCSVYFSGNQVKKKRNRKQWEKERTKMKIKREEQTEGRNEGAKDGKRKGRREVLYYLLRDPSD